MVESIVPEELLLRSKKILFITHLAIGDFTYLQNFFMAFKLAHPHLAVDLWVDERRRTYCFWRWNYLKKYALFDWIKTCPYFNKIYSETYSPFSFKRSIKQARQEKYDIIVSLAIVDIYTYVALARKINNKAFITAYKKNHRGYHPFEQAIIKKINGTTDYVAQSHEHITDVYAAWFEQLFGLQVEKNDRKPFVIIPRVWLLHAKLQLMKWGVNRKNNTFSRVVFINSYAKDKKRSWPLQYVFELIKTIRQNDPWLDIVFIINAPPEHVKFVSKTAYKYSLTQTHIISADLNFFQLPAFIAVSDLVISVETSVMHLASALDIPVIALMRTKNPEWHPWDTGKVSIIQCVQRNDWVRNIPLASVIGLALDHTTLKSSLYRSE